MFGSSLDSLSIPIKPLRTVLDFLSVKILTQKIFVKISIKHNNYLAARFLGDNDPFSSKSLAQILSLNFAYTFSFEFFNHWFVWFLN